MAKNRSNDFASFLRSQGLRKNIAKALSDLESGGRDARGSAEKLARRAIADLRSAAEEIEKRLDISGVGSRSSAAKKGARTRQRAGAKRRSTAEKGAGTRPRQTPGTQKNSGG